MLHLTIDSLFLLGFHAKLQILAAMMSLFDKLVAKDILVFSMFSRVPEKSEYLQRWTCYLHLFVAKLRLLTLRLNQ